MIVYKEPLLFPLEETLENYLSGCPDELRLRLRDALFDRVTRRILAGDRSVVVCRYTSDWAEEVKSFPDAVAAGWIRWGPGFPVEVIDRTAGVTLVLLSPESDLDKVMEAAPTEVQARYQVRAAAALAPGLD
jgi:hypothetical protein